MTTLNDTDVALFKQNSLFEGFTDIQLKEVMSFMTEMTFQAGEIIINEHEISDVIYIIKQGDVQIEKWDKQTHRAHVITYLTVGAVIGEIAALDGAPPFCNSTC